MLILDDLQTYDVRLMLKVYKLSFIEISNLHKVLRTHLTNLLLSYKQTKWEITVYLEKKMEKVYLNSAFRQNYFQIGFTIYSFEFCWRNFTPQMINIL